MKTTSVISKIKLMAILALSVMANSLQAQRVTAITSDKPTSCGSTDGSIKLAGLLPNTTYTIQYQQVGAAAAVAPLNSDANGNLVIPYLSAGKYVGLKVNSVSYPTPVTLTDDCHVDVSSTNPTSCNFSDGTITVYGLIRDSSYLVNFKKDGKQQPTKTIKANSSNSVVISDLESGNYSEINATNSGIVKQSLVPTVTLTDEIGKIGKNTFQVFGALYSGATVKDDNSTNLTQSYLRFNIPFGRKKGKDCDCDPGDRWVVGRNLFAQVTYSTNIDDLHYVDSTGNTGKNQMGQNRYVNRLDLFQHANFNVNFDFPFVTYFIPEMKGNGDLMHLYIEPTFSILRTTISDSVSFQVTSLLYGFNVGIRTENLNPFTLELNAKVFGISPVNSAINPNLNFQYENRNAFVPLGQTKLTTFSQTYLNLDALIIYNTNPSNADGSSNVFVHFSAYANVPSANQLLNSYFQLQLGYALNINNLVSTLSSKNKGTTSGS